MKVRPSVQAVIIDEKTNRLLLIKKLDLVRKRYLWRLVKGGIDEGETEEQALKREIGEEVGLKNIEIVNKIYNYEYEFGQKKFTVSTYLVKTDINEKVVLQTDGEESPIVDYKWITKEEAIKMLYWQHEKEVVKLLK